MSKFHFIERSIFIVDRYAFHGVQTCISAIDDFSKDSVFSIKMRLLGVRDEELRLVGVWARISHGYDAAGIELFANEEPGVLRFVYGQQKSGDSAIP